MYPFAMKSILVARYEVAYYDAQDGRTVYWPADNRSDVLRDKLRECRAAGHTDARLSEAGGAYSGAAG
jgi:hypothetical protein